MSIEEFIQAAVRNERERCLRIVEEAQPDIAGTSGLELQMRNGQDWTDAVKRTIIRKIQDFNQP